MAPATPGRGETLRSYRGLHGPVLPSVWRVVQVDNTTATVVSRLIQPELRGTLAEDLQLVYRQMMDAAGLVEQLRWKYADRELPDVWVLDGFTRDALIVARDVVKDLVELRIDANGNAMAEDTALLAAVTRGDGQSTE